VYENPGGPWSPASLLSTPMPGAVTIYAYFKVAERIENICAIILLGAKAIYLQVGDRLCAILDIFP